MQIRVEKTSNPKAKPNEASLGFGKYFTDHMFLMDYEEGKGWHDARIVPYAPFELDPAAMVMHYGQATFEGLKAFPTKDGRILLFRPELNARRFNASNERLGIPEIDESVFVESIRRLVRLDAEWIPSQEGTSLYIRPFVIATEAALGVRESSRYLFAVILSPVGSYYTEGVRPVDIYVERGYVRAVRGGTGAAKTPANYASGLRAQQEARRHGCSQVLWLDAIERRYVEEVGSMNAFFDLNGEICTPKLSGSILAGVTRNTVLQLLKEWGCEPIEREISAEELLEAAETGKLAEAFGTGTAAVIAPIGGLYSDKRYGINDGEVGPWASRLLETITSIQRGETEDHRGWTIEC